MSRRNALAGITANVVSLVAQATNPWYASFACEVWEWGAGYSSSGGICTVEAVEEESEERHIRGVLRGLTSKSRVETSVLERLLERLVIQEVENQ